MKVRELINKQYNNTSIKLNSEYKIIFEIVFDLYLLNLKLL